ncbi:hypothetical protein FBUS_11842, partial [Fasciolopsis buskii]
KITTHPPTHRYKLLREDKYADTHVLIRFILYTWPLSTHYSFCFCEPRGSPDGGRITLADYLDSLDGSGSSAKLLRSIPQVAPVRRFPGSTGPVGSDPLLVPNSTEGCTSAQQFHGFEDQAGDTDLPVNGTVVTTVGEAVNGPSTGIMLMANGSSSSEKMLSNASLPGATRSRSFTAPPDYLIKRRFFLLERLVERYDELLKLMNEEL